MNVNRCQTLKKFSSISPSTQIAHCTCQQDMSSQNTNRMTTRAKNQHQHPGDLIPKQKRRTKAQMEEARRKEQEMKSQEVTKLTGKIKCLSTLQNDISTNEVKAHVGIVDDTLTLCTLHNVLTSLKQIDKKKAATIYSQFVTKQYGGIEPPTPQKKKNVGPWEMMERKAATFCLFSQRQTPQKRRSRIQAHSVTRWLRKRFKRPSRPFKRNLPAGHQLVRVHQCMKALYK